MANLRDAYDERVDLWSLGVLSLAAKGATLGGRSTTKKAQHNLLNKLGCIHGHIGACCVVRYFLKTLYGFALKLVDLQRLATTIYM